MAISRDLRSRVLNSAPARLEGRFVLYWMTATRRLEDNFALDRALAWSAELGKPLLIFEALRADYRWASPRHHRVILDAMAEHQAVLAKQSVRYFPYVERAAGDSKGLLAALEAEACVTITDRHPGFFFPRMLEAARKLCTGRLEAVDSVGLLPLDAAPGPLPSAYVLRRRLQKNLPTYLATPASAQPLAQYKAGAASIPRKTLERWAPATATELAPSFALESKIPLAHKVPIASWQGGSLPAKARLAEFLNSSLGRYDEIRMQGSPASGLSMALHYGFLSPQRVLEDLLLSEGTELRTLLPQLEQNAVRPNGKREGWWGVSPAAETFLDQFVTWRELGHRFQDQNPDSEEYGSQPDWALKTTEAHRSDVREFAYRAEQFENACTHDPLWNAAQRCLVREGWMPNYLRMLWAKLLLWWSQDPAEAWELLFHLNNLYALDGRDPNSMAGITWCFGRFDRAFGPERPVIGKLRPMTAANTRRKMQLGDFLERYGASERLFV
jgi:deoxyribodipyrimidine photo-lyase